jgi:hypothetical protein
MIERNEVSLSFVSSVENTHRQREREIELDRERELQRVCVCVTERERERERGREREREDESALRPERSCSSRISGPLFNSCAIPSTSVVYESRSTLERNHRKERKRE